MTALPLGRSRPPRVASDSGRSARTALALSSLLLLGGCSSLSSWIPSIPVPNFSALWGGGKTIAPLPEIQASVAPSIAWQASVGDAKRGLLPAVTPNAVYAAGTDGTIVRIDRATGEQAWRISAEARLSGGVGADDNLLAVGTDKGEVLAFDSSGKPLWRVRVTSEVVGPPTVGSGVVAVWSGDGKLYALSATDGKTRWVYQRTNPPLIVRNQAGGVIDRGALFFGTAGGKLLAIDLTTGAVGWEGNVATPKGATELERIADITSRPVLDDRQICAVAFQGRIACFELLRGQLNWTRDVSSISGIAADQRYLFVTDDKGAVLAFDKATGTSVWKQDKLGKRLPSGPQMISERIGVVDAEGYLHVLDPNDGNIVGRLATDGSPATGQPAQSGANEVWLSTGGALFAATIR